MNLATDIDKDQQEEKMKKVIKIIQNYIENYN
jgi:hypothetical protein